jgi:ubiquinone/menaquinone biosynthesis C-methylase UbiE
MSAWKKKRDIMRRYDVTAGIYDLRYAEEQTAKIEAALAHLKDSTGAVLDAGCGTGVLFSYVAGKACMTVGVDSSKKTLLAAKEHAKNYPKVHLIQADADNMPLRDKVFEKVFAITLIQNTPSPSATLKEIKRVANDNASIVVTGMKKAFNKTALKQMLRSARLNVTAMENEHLKCYVAVCTKA